MNLTRIQGESDILDLAGRIWLLAPALIVLLVMISKKRLDSKWREGGFRGRGSYPVELECDQVVSIDRWISHALLSHLL